MFYAKSFSYLQRSAKLLLKTGNGVIQTGNGTFYPISRPQIKRLLLHIHQEVLHWSLSQDIQMGKGIIYPSSRPLRKKILLQKVFPIYHGVQNLFLNQVSNRIIQTGNWFISKTFGLGLWSRKLFHLINWFSKQDIELSKQEMELFLLFPGHW